MGGQHEFEGIGSFVGRLIIYVFTFKSAVHSLHALQEFNHIEMLTKQLETWKYAPSNQSLSWEFPM